MLFLKDKRERISTSIILLLIFVFYVIKLLPPVLIDYLYKNSNYEFLNFLTHSSANNSLEYYQGMIQDVLFGPLSILISTSALILFCFTFLKEANSKIFWIAIFFYLILSRFDILFYPPYGDSASGPFIEAIWLSEHSFNYIGLAKQKSFVLGGPKAYLFSIYPTYIALMMKLIKSAKLFSFVNHLIVFGLGATVISYFRRILLKLYDKEIALLLSLSFLSMPLFQSQVEQLNMEMPLLTFSIIAIYFLANKNLKMACLMSILAALFKGVGVLICAVVIAGSLLLFFYDEKYKFKFNTILWGILTFVFVVIKMYAAFFILNKEGNVVMVGPFQGLPKIMRLPTTYLYILSLLIFMGKYIVSLFKDKTISFFSFIHKEYIAFIMFASAASWYCLYLNSFGMQYRYRLLLTPFIIFCVFYAINNFIKSHFVLETLLVSFIIISLICSYGLIYKQQIASVHAVFERSLEYRNDIKMQMKLCKEIEEKYSDFTIGAPFTVAQILAFPELGYIKKDLKVVIYGYPCTYKRIKVFNGLKNLNLLKTVWIGLKSDFIETMGLPDKYYDVFKGYPIDKDDKVLEKILIGNKKATIFMGGFCLEKARILTRAILGHLQKVNKLKDYLHESLGE